MFGNQYRYVFILLLSVYSYLNILFTEGDRLFGVELSPWIFFGSLTLIVLILWETNRFLELKLPAIGKIHPLLVQFGLSILAVLLIALLFTFIFPSLATSSLSTSITFKLAIGFAFRVNLFLHCVNAIVYFMNKNKLNELEKQTLLKETAEAKFDVLRNQVNPHFLFNSFNVLTSLVHKDADTASRFIEQLSSVYRYVLNNQNNKIVPIQKELEFLDAYLFLLQIRFGGSLTMINELNKSDQHGYIAPATLQMLIENAIKHNIISKANPLSIRIYQDDNYYVVENILQPKPVKEESTSTGLKNIRQRYEFLCQHDAIRIHSNGKFTVKIPILRDIDEGTNR